MDESGYQSPFQPSSCYDFYDAEGRDAHHALKASAHHGSWGSFGQTQSEAQNLHSGAIRHGRHEKPEGCWIQPAPVEAPNQIPDFRQQGTQQPVSAFDPNQESGTSYRQFEYASAAYRDTARHLTHMQFAPNPTPGPSHATHAEPYPHNVTNLSYLAPYNHYKDYRMPMVPGSNWENRPAFPSHSNQRPELKHDATPYHQHQHHHSATSTIANQPMTAPIAMLREIPSDVNAAPWNPFVAVEGGRTTGDVRPMQTGGGQYFPDTTHSSSAFNNIGKSRLVRSDCGTPSSSTARSYNPMPGAMLTGRSYQLDSLTPPHNFPTPSRRAFSRQDTQSTFGRVETPARMRQHLNTQPRLELDYQSLPQNQRRLSSAISQTTEASTIGTASNSTGGVLECSFPDCGATFNGKWNRGNRSRHERTCHGDAAPLQCEYSPCTKTFKRSDARSKHYKKHHQEPAANSSSVRRPAREDQDVALKGISTWYT